MTIDFGVKESQHLVEPRMDEEAVDAVFHVGPVPRQLRFLEVFIKANALSLERVCHCAWILGVVNVADNARVKSFF